jgi:glycosyltransferase involved in cell wall biosynthesis
MEFGINNERKLVFHNPHSLWLKDNVYCFLNEVKSIKKYDYIFDLYYRNDDKIHIFLTRTDESLLFKGFLRFLNLPIIEFYVWVYLNKLNPFKFNVFTRPRKIPSNYVLFTFLYGTFSFSNIIDEKFKYRTAKIFSKIKCTKLVHLSHYGYNSQLASKLTDIAKIDYFISESNLSITSQFFREQFKWYKKDVIILPFVFQDRFEKRIDFSLRKNLALSTGSNTHKMKDINFINFFKTDLLQPLRTEIAYNSDRISDKIDSMINNMQIVDSEIYKQNLFSKFILTDFKNIYKILSRKKVTNKIERDSLYYKLDIVNKYNEYKMFVVPEEIIGFPGIGFVEGMACGCAYIGLDHDMYRDLGMIPGKHYITFDGSLQDLLSTIEYYQKNQNELEVIADNGYSFVKKKFNNETVFLEFKKNLNNLN